MVNEQEAQKLINRFIELRAACKKDPENKDLEKEFRKHERLCLEKFKYLITMRTAKYRAFPNYDDLNQEGMEALMKAMNNYDPDKGSFFWWSHKYIETRVARSANLHTAIRYPLKYARENKPHKEPLMPLLVEDKILPDRNVEDMEIKSAINDAAKYLSEEQFQVLNLAFGMDGDKPMSINAICKTLQISRKSCIKTLNGAFFIIKQKIKL